MPRPISGNCEAQRHRMIEYRARLAEKGEQETDAVDTALSAALSRYIEASLDTGTKEGQLVAATLEGMAVQGLVRKSIDDAKAVNRVLDRATVEAAAQRRVANRIYYLQMIQRHPDATEGDRRRFLIGPAPYGADPLDWDDAPDIHLIEEPDDQPYAYADEDYDDEAA
ncbi:hypothetical protein [Agrobacterium sp. B1(2019)]|uniref:hypothetical protein n=1 Tax=Agrobacterium sp. B1(2019) TaxID=2607032 RepID=UPI0011EF0811|nr:hypothetical protein [Agrobacterium sp. B1(2019)]TZG36637.1 hypothetical protein AGR1_03825 [Agrobacterium sp. B1(2019)]